MPISYGELLSTYPLGRPAKVHEITDLFLFLASFRSGYTSGTVFTVDGGIASRRAVKCSQPAPSRSSAPFTQRFLHAQVRNTQRLLRQTLQHAGPHVARAEHQPLRSAPDGARGRHQGPETARRVPRLGAPPVGFEELRTLIREDLRLPEACAMVTDGAVEALYNVCSNICGPGTDFVTTDPSWAWPMHFARKAGANVVELPIYNAEQGYKLSVEQLRAAVNQKTRVIYLVDPNNPLGTCHTEDEIRAIADIARSVGGLPSSMTGRTATSPTSSRRRSSSTPEKSSRSTASPKWLGLAGMRLGAVLASEEMIEASRRHRPATSARTCCRGVPPLRGCAASANGSLRCSGGQRRNQAEVAEGGTGRRRPAPFRSIRRRPTCSSSRR